ncbi:uncharacterized protein LOC120518693 isoform X2 [Polypterus senegalus]|uniref:uncharacterized protein LOC120518693 isoform X2 n=1 Tax=Polypterus senegalus TaxID=55291 RepID=UPI00196513EF|nr:uncharacterized protein LOC120518693 isoform X2 [Polypterus senegalus]
MLILSSDALFFLFLHNIHIFCAVKFSIIGPSEPIITYVGEDVILPASHQHSTRRNFNSAPSCLVFAHGDWLFACLW